MKRKLRQLWTYPGSKSTHDEEYVSRFPPKYHTYVSLFAGTAMDIACKEPSPVEICNDRDRRVFDVFSALQRPKDYEQLVHLAVNTPNSREQFEVCCRILRDPPRKHSRVRRAWAFLVVGACCRGGLHPALTRSMPAATTRDEARRKLHTLPERLANWRDRLRHVRLENRHWYWIFDKYDGQRTFSFADPPYLRLTLRSGRLYQHELTVKMHAKLLRAFNRAKGYVMLCGYNHPMYTSYLFHWPKFQFPAKATMGETASPRTEAIWMNYLPDGTKIGGNKLFIAKRYVETLGGAKSAQRYLDRIGTLMSFPKPSDAQAFAQPVWLDYANDGRSLATTKLLIAKRYVELLGSPASAQKYLDRIATLLSLSK